MGIFLSQLLKLQSVLLRHFGHWMQNWPMLVIILAINWTDSYSLYEGLESYWDKSIEEGC